MSRVNHLLLVIRSRFLTHNLGDLLRNQKLKVLRQKSKLTDATKGIAGKKTLSHEPIRDALALAKNNPSDHETVTELEKLQFLLTDSHHFTDMKHQDLAGIQPRPDSRKYGSPPQVFKRTLSLFPSKSCSGA